MSARPWPGDDPYRVLGVPRDASPAEITRAFRRLARSRHPDVTGEATEQEYRRIREAYERLTHDAPPPNSGARPPSRGVRIPVRVRPAARHGRDVAVTVEVSLEELVTGTSRRPAGAGLENVRVRIPAGLAPGTRIRVDGHGEPGRHGGDPGDLIVTVRLRPHPDFAVDGRDLRTRVPVSYPELVLGARVPLRVPGHGTVPLPVPAGTTPGTPLRVPGRGLPASGRDGAGDLIAVTELHVPTGLSPQARRAVGELARHLPQPRGDQRR